MPIHATGPRAPTGADSRPTIRGGRPLPDIDPDGPDARSLGERLAEEAEAFNRRMEAYRLRFEATHFGPAFTPIEWVELPLLAGRRLVASCTLDCRVVRAVVDQSGADGSWAAYALAGDWTDQPVHRLRRAAGEREAQREALDAAWALLDPAAFGGEA